MVSNIQNNACEPKEGEKRVQKKFRLSFGLHKTGLNAVNPGYIFPGVEKERFIYLLPNLLERLTIREDRVKNLGWGLRSPHSRKRKPRPGSFASHYNPLSPEKSR